MTEISGRGVGLDAVKQFFIKEKGNVSLRVLEDITQNKECVPFELIMTLPSVAGVYQQQISK